MGRQVVIRGEAFDYAAKEPYVRSGKSIEGALELNEAGDKTKCHECGRFQKGLGPHAFRGHGMTAREYRARHGLTTKTSLTAPVIKARRASLMVAIRNRERAMETFTIARRTPGFNRSRTPAPQNAESRNLALRCREQLISRIRQIAKEVGGAPLWRELKACGIHEKPLKRALGTSRINDVMIALGLEPNHDSSLHFTREILIELIRDANSDLHRVPGERDCGRGYLPGSKIFRKVFGSWSGALEAAGFGLIAHERMDRMRATLSV